MQNLLVQNGITLNAKQTAEFAVYASTVMSARYANKTQIQRNSILQETLPVLFEDWQRSTGDVVVLACFVAGINLTRSELRDHVSNLIAHNMIHIYMLSGDTQTPVLMKTVGEKIHRVPLLFDHEPTKDQIKKALLACFDTAEVNQ